VTAGSDVPNRESFIGGYEHIWDEAIKMKVESVMQSHPNTNMNILARTKYVHENYPPPKNPLLYGVERTARYLNIVRACTQARLGNPRLVNLTAAACVIKTAAGIGNLQILDAEVPRPGAGEALVRVGPSVCAAQTCSCTTVCTVAGTAPCRHLSSSDTKHRARSLSSGRVRRASAWHARGHRGGHRLRLLSSLRSRQLQPLSGLAPHRAHSLRRARRVRRRAGDVAAAASR
jgi:hypothetical protein